jgi:hypothetical protein
VQTIVSWLRWPLLDRSDSSERLVGEQGLAGDAVHDGQGPRDGYETATAAGLLRAGVVTARGPPTAARLVHVLLRRAETVAASEAVLHLATGGIEPLVGLGRSTDAHQRGGGHERDREPRRAATRVAGHAFLHGITEASRPRQRKRRRVGRRGPIGCRSDPWSRRYADLTSRASGLPPVSCQRPDPRGITQSGELDRWVSDTQTQARVASSGGDREDGLPRRLGPCPRSCWRVPRRLGHRAPGCGTSASGCSLHPTRSR